MVGGGVITSREIQGCYIVSATLLPAVFLYLQDWRTIGKCTVTWKFLVRQDMHQQAFQCMKDAEEYVKDVELDTRITGDALWAIGELYYGLGHVSKPRQAFLNMLEYLKTVWPWSYSLLGCIYNFKWYRSQSGKFEAALTHASRAHVYERNILKKIMPTLQAPTIILVCYIGLSVY